MNCINKLNGYGVSFGNVSFGRHNEYDFQENNNNYKYRQFAIGVSSFAIPGLGQLINGEPPKGLAMFLSGFLASVLYYARRGKGAVAGIFPWLLGIGIKCWSAVDAYKRAS